MIIKPDDTDEVLILTGEDARHVAAFLESKRSADEMDISRNNTDNQDQNSRKNIGKSDGKRKKLNQSSSNNMFTKDSCDLKAAKELIDNYIESDENGCIEISNISKADRHQLHKYAGAKGLKHWSTGSESSRIMSIQKK